MLVFGRFPAVCGEIQGKWEPGSAEHQIERGHAGTLSDGPLSRFDAPQTRNVCGGIVQRQSGGGERSCLTATDVTATGLDVGPPHEQDSGGSHP
jgi:hypothetical protein